MLRKISILLSFLSILALGFALSMPSASHAKDQNKPQQQKKKIHVQPQKKIIVNKNVVVKKKYIIGHKYNGHVWYGYHRHRWRGVWYAYGVGPCWINIDGIWFWNVLACPD